MGGPWEVRLGSADPQNHAIDIADKSFDKLHICGGSCILDRLHKVNQLKISGGSCILMEWK